jgi:hypothetical protein
MQNVAWRTVVCRKNLPSKMCVRYLGGEGLMVGRRGYTGWKIGVVRCCAVWSQLLGFDAGSEAKPMKSR